jgi:hypothetical protein
MSEYRSAALEKSKVIKATSGYLRYLLAYNTAGSAKYIQLHDSATLPADTAVPAAELSIAAHSSAILDLTKTPMTFKNGIVVCNSSTDATKTIGSDDCLFFAIYF